MTEEQKKNYLKKIDDVISKGQYKDNWDSLTTYPTPKWYKEAKFGIFSHWGIYSVPAYFSEWYPRMMFYKMNPVYWHHRRKYGKKFNYHDFIPQFTAEKFDPNEWLRIIKDSGAKFYMPVGEHHDGFKMYETDLSRWKSTTMGPKRDVLGEIKESCDKNDIVFCTSNHRAENYWFLNGARTIGYDNAVLDEEYRDLYGEAVNVNKRNNVFTLLKNERGIDPTVSWMEDWLVSACDQIDRYQPQGMYFDWYLMHKMFKPYYKKFLAYYYNRSLEWKKEVFVTYKYDAIMMGAGIIDQERGQMDYTFPETWQGSTSTAYNAWSYCTNNKFKSVNKVIGTFIDVISKNGTFMLNIGPKAEGTICDEEKKILSEMGRFIRTNKEAIYGTSYFRIFGEGVVRKAGSFAEKFEYTNKEYRFTYKPGSLYVFNLNPSGNKFTLKTFNKYCDQKNGFNYVISDIKILGQNNKVTWEQDYKGLHLTIEGDYDNSLPICFKFAID